ncbi:hypothetical protein QFC24_002717 [Naganishia onofrii]|uniref:Uncharacterized protein n=1 Tax=Naganishia onofrii TaxID=1851511 RepID=A0ACC2XPM6_9TREE|nr:hypothetical protein QFC24_002717 [Naganishia onofrii]
MNRRRMLEDGKSQRSLLVVEMTRLLLLGKRLPLLEVRILAFSPPATHPNQPPPPLPLPHPIPPASITSTNRFSALSLGSPSSHGATHKKSLPRTSASGAGKHKVDSSADASAPTKLQKKNAATAAAKKAAKEAEEKERLERLAKYRKEQVK